MAIRYTEIFESFPQELRLPIARLVDALKEEFGVSKADFDDLKGIVRELAEAQRRTEIRVEELAEAQRRTEERVEELAEAQRRTEERVEELAEAQRRTEERVEELAEAQRRTEEQVEKLGRAVEELALSHKMLSAQIGGLGARWGLQTEEAFRQGIRAILQEVGYTTERFLEYDRAGEVFGHPDQIELDVVIKDGKLLVIEIKSALSKSDVYSFERKVAFYTQQTERQVDRKLIITPSIDARAREVAERLGVEIYSDVTVL